MRKRTPGKVKSGDDGGTQRMSITNTIHRDSNPYSGKTKVRNYNIGKVRALKE